MAARVRGIHQRFRCAQELPVLYRRSFSRCFRRCSFGESPSRAGNNAGDRWRGDVSSFAVGIAAANSRGRFGALYSLLAVLIYHRRCALVCDGEVWAGGVFARWRIYWFRRGDECAACGELTDLWMAMEEFCEIGGHEVSEWLFELASERVVSLEMPMCRCKQVTVLMYLHLRLSSWLFWSSDKLWLLFTFFKDFMIYYNIFAD